MLEILGKGYRLVSRGGAGLSCDENGLSLGEVALVQRRATKSTQPYATVDGPRLAAILTSAYGQVSAAEIQWIATRLTAITRALNTGNPTLAAIAAVHMRFPELSAHAVCRLRSLAAIQKEYNPDQPRVPAGNPDGGQWTSDQGSQSGADRRPAQTAQLPVPMPLPMPIPGFPASPTVPNIPFPHLFDPPPVNPFPDRPECVEEWNAAYKFCRDQMIRGKLKPGFSGFGKNFNRCVLGQVSADCGGNPTGEG